MGQDDGGGTIWRQRCPDRCCSCGCEAKREPRPVVSDVIAFALRRRHVPTPSSCVCAVSMHTLLPVPNPNRMALCGRDSPKPSCHQRAGPSPKKAAVATGAGAGAALPTPKTILKDGESLDVKSQSSATLYTIKRTGDHYYCTCPAWRNQNAPVNGRTCKHLRLTLGDVSLRPPIREEEPPSQHCHFPSDGN